MSANKRLTKNGFTYRFVKPFFAWNSSAGGLAGACGTEIHNLLRKLTLSSYQENLRKDLPQRRSSVITLIRQ